MLAKISRLSSRKEIEEIKRIGRYWSTPLLGMLVQKEVEDKKFGVIISKKVSKKAVERNRIRRLIMDGVRKTFTDWPEKTRVVFLVKTVANSKREIEIERELLSLRMMIQK